MPHLVWRQESASLSCFFFALDGSEDWCLGAMLGKKKKAKNPPRGGERYWKLRELRLFYFYFERFSFILKYKLRGSCKTEPSSPV